MIKAKTGLAGVLERLALVARLVRPVDPPAPPYERCAGCRRGSRDDQQVPDPAQFTTKKGVTPAGDVVGNAATVPAKVFDPVEAAVAVALTDAPPVWCARCRSWYHAVGCYSLHTHP